MDKRIPVIVAVVIIVILFFFLYNQETYAKIVPLRACTQDSDCVLTPAACFGNACPDAINQKYKSTWESLPESAATVQHCALIGQCGFAGREFKAVCQNNMCESVPLGLTIPAP